MNKLIKLSLTVLILGIGNWITAIVFDFNSVDVSIPFAVASIFIIYIFTNKRGASGRIMDMQIQGRTGIRMGFENRVTSVFCKRKVHKIAMKNTQACQPSN